jgi:hypothetical protein
MAGDTVLKLLLDSDQHLQSQNRYISLHNGQTLIDHNYCQSFKYDQISQMSLINFSAVNKLQLFDQLCQLDQSDLTAHWMLKTHCYFDFPYPVIDIVAGPEFMPFVIKASLQKNPEILNYHVLMSKIKDPELLYKFNCFNYAQDLVQNKPLSDQQISLQDILSGWDIFVTALKQVDLEISQKCQVYYSEWTEQNKKFMPSTVFTQLIQHNNFDYNCAGLTLEEKYCMLSLAGKKFKVLT